MYNITDLESFVLQKVQEIKDAEESGDMDRASEARATMFTDCNVIDNQELINKLTIRETIND